MKPKCKNDRFNQQHKLYEQGRRLQITQLVSSLHACLPRDHKPKKDNQTDILSSVLGYVQFLQSRANIVNSSILQDDIRRELETLKAYVTELEERCNRYANLLDAKRSGNDQPTTRDSQTKQSQGSVSVIAASAPLVFLVSQHTAQAIKATANAETSTEPFDPMRSDLSDKSHVVVQDGSTNTDIKIFVETETETEARNFDIGKVAVEVQVGASGHCDRGCSPIALSSQAVASNVVGSVESSRKRQSTTADVTDNSAAVSTDATNRNGKRRRSDESAPSISEIVNLVASNELGTTEQAATAETSKVSGKESNGPCTDRDASASALLSVNALLHQQNLPQDHGRQGLPAVPAAVSAAPTGTMAPTPASAPTPVVTTVASSWYNNFPPAEAAQQSYNHNSNQPHQNHQASSHQHRPRHQQPQQPSATRDNRQQQSAAPVYQGTSTETNHGTYSSVAENQTSGGRMNENCSKSTSSRRGANFSVEFLHGGGTNLDSERLQQQDVHNHQRQNQSAAGRSSGTTGQSYRVESDQSASSMASCGYYNLQHGAYPSNAHWPTRDHSWTSEPSYQWWNNQTAPNSFSQSSSASQSRQLTGANAVLTGAGTSNNKGPSSSSSNKQSSSGQQSTSRNMHEDQSACVNLANSAFGSGTSSVSTPVISITTSVNSWPTASHGYSTSTRFGYCTPSTLFDPPAFNYIRHDAASRKSLPTSTGAPSLNATTISSATCHSYSNHYWPTSDWPSSSSFPASSSTASSFSLEEHSGHHQNHGKAQNFQIATMFPEASLPGSNTASWRSVDGYQRRDHNQHSDTFGNARVTTTASNYTSTMQAPAYRQVTADSSCNGAPRFS